MAEPSDSSARFVPKASDRRSRNRQSLEASKRLVAAVGDDFYLAKVRNISAGGISLILGRSVENGTTLSVDLIETKTNRFSRTLEVRVAYCIEHPSGDWIL